jgi:cell division protease FtsH
MDILHAMAEALLKYETIDAKQLEDLMAGRVPQEPKGWSDTSSKEPPSSSATQQNKEKISDDSQRRNMSEDDTAKSH